MMKRKLIALIGTAALMLCAGCQPTPAVEAVAQKQDPQAVVSAQGAEQAGADGAEVSEPAAYAPAVYKQDGHWTDTAQKGSFLTVTADADVMVPENATYPVQKLGKMEISQERAEELIHYFAGDMSFYKMPLEQTKSDLEQQILSMKETLAYDQAQGYTDALEADQEAIDELQRQWEQAPDEAEHVPSDLKYTYALDYNGQELTEYGENIIEVAGKNSEGVLVSIYVRKRGEGSDGASFSYACGSFTTEENARENADLATEFAAAEELSEPEKSEQLEWLNETQQTARTLVERFDTATFDVEAGQQKAIQVFEELGISGVQITHIEKALCALDTGEQPEKGTTWDNASIPCTCVDFARQAGGLPCITESAGYGLAPGTDPGSVYSAPFYPETGTMIVDTEGKVLMFTWDQPTDITAIISDSSDPLPLDEVKNRIVDQLYYNLGAPLGEATSESATGNVTYSIDEVRLVMSYVNAKDAPESALTVPAWCAKAHGSGTYVPDPSDPDMTIDAYDQEILINALDGSPILMPGTVQDAIIA